MSKWFGSLASWIFLQADKFSWCEKGTKEYSSWNALMLLRITYSVFRTMTTFFKWILRKNWGFTVLPFLNSPVITVVFCYLATLWPWPTVSQNFWNGFWFSIDTFHTYGKKILESTIFKTNRSICIEVEDTGINVRIRHFIFLAILHVNST